MTDHDTTRRMVEAFCAVIAQDDPTENGAMTRSALRLITMYSPEVVAAAFTAAEAARWQDIATAPVGKYVKAIFADEKPDALVWVSAGGWETHWLPFVPPGPSVEGGR